MVKKDKTPLLDVIIDKLTNSIENIQTGETFDTDVARLTNKDLKLISKPDWQFNWKKKLMTAQKKYINFQQSATLQSFRDLSVLNINQTIFLCIL